MTILRTSAALAATIAASLLTSTLHAATAVAPNPQATTLGNGQDNDTNLFNRRGDTDGLRFQQIYDVGQFSSFGASSQISTIAFRAKQNGGLFPGIFGPSLTVSDIRIRLTTTQHNSSIDGPNNIDGTFANNIDGPALTSVYTGSLSLTTATAGTTDFGYVINLQTPFTYNKSAGNLLLDVLIPDGATTTESGFSGYSRPDTQTGEALGANANDGVASAFGATAGATIGANTTTGLVTQFTTVPEPTSIALLSGGLMLAGLRRRRSAAV